LGEIEEIIMNEHKYPLYNDEIDLREIVATLLHHWKTILIVTIFSAALAVGSSLIQTPVYQAVVAIKLPQAPLIPRETVYWLTEEAIQQKVAEELAAGPLNIPPVAVTKDRSDPILYTLSVESDDSSQVAKIANSWASIGISNFSDKVTSVDFANIALEAYHVSDQAVRDYLRQNNLEYITLTELAWIMGVGGSSQSWPPNNYELPDLTAEQLDDLTVLMEEWGAAQVAYFNAFSNTVKLRQSLAENPPYILESAVQPAKPIKPNISQNAYLGALAGMIISILSVFTVGWWRKEDHQYATSEE